MSHRVPTLALVLLAALLPTLAACGDPPEPPPLIGAAPPTATAPDPVPVAPAPLLLEGEGTDDDPAESEPPKTFDIEQAREDRAARRQQMDANGRGLMTSFKSRVLSPRHDAGLLRAEALVSVRVGEKRARVVVDFDHDREMDDRSEAVLDTTQPSTAVPRGAVEQVRKLAQLSMNGAYRHVVHYYPPIQVLLTPSRKGPNRVVTAQPHAQEIQASYSIDGRDLIVTRGTTVDDAGRAAAEIVHYEWAFFRGRYRLVKQWHEGGSPTIEFEYDEFDGVVLLRRATIRKGDASAVFEFAYSRIEVGEPTDPPKRGK